MRTLLWVCRHGSTVDSGKGIFRGQRDSSLDQKGFVDAHDAKKFFNDKSWHRIFTSDLKRGVQTAIIISGNRENEIMPPVRGLRPWNIGYLTGKEKKIYGKDMEVFINNPDMTPQDGESRNEFEAGRIKPLLAEGIEMGLVGRPPIVIGHSSVIHALGHLLYGEHEDEVSVKPGGVVEVYLDGDEIKSRAVLKPGKDDSSFAAGQS
jgi:broad specificity phosphatase PhoE